MNLQQQFTDNLQSLKTGKLLRYTTPHIPVCIEEDQTALTDEWMLTYGGFEYAVQYGKNKLWLFVGLSNFYNELQYLESNNFDEQQEYIVQNHHVFALLQENFKDCFGFALKTFLNTSKVAL